MTTEQKIQYIADYYGYVDRQIERINHEVY